MSDEQLREIAVAVRHRTDALPPMPAPWEALERRHRNGILRRGSAAAAVMATAAAVLLAVTTGLGSLSTTQGDVVPAGPWPGDPGLTQGSPWAAELARHVPVDLGGSAAGAEASVLYAADVDGARVAMVRLTQTDPDLPDYWWFTGPAGAAADAMQNVGGYDAGRAFIVLLPLATPKAPEVTVLALSYGGAEMSVWTNDDVTRDGRVTSPHVPGHEIAEGVYTARLKVPLNHAHVELTNLPGGEWGEFASNSEVQAPPTSDSAWWAAAAPGARGDAAAAGPPERALIRGVYNTLALPSQVPGSRVLWTVRDGQDRYSAVALRAPSGGWAVAGIHTEPPVTSADGGVSEGSSVMAAAARPDDPGRLSLAWYLDTAVDDAGDLYPTGDRLALVGPPAATQVRLTSQDTATVTLPLADGAGLVRRPGVGTVEFLDGEGRPLDRVDVTEPLQPNSRLPGAR